MKFSRVLAFAAAVTGIGALAATGLSAAPAQANPAGTGVVINELYAVGGSSGAPYTNKFVELYNPGSEPVSLDGWSIQYRSATGTSNPSGVGALSGTIDAGGYYLVQMGSNGSNGTALPTPDATTGLNPSGSSGLVLLVDQATALNPGTGDIAGAAGVVDAVGYGTANTYEGAAAAGLGGTSDQRSTQRTDFVDTDNNAADFSRATPTPMNSTSTGTPGTTPPGTTPPATPPPATTPPATTVPVGDAIAITEIQGSGDASPLLGQTVTTEGVVTGVYATGGLAGFNIQMPGAADTAGTASSGIFVYAPQLASTVALGDSVRITGLVGEYYGSTQITATQVSPLAEALAPVVPASVAWPETAAERERWEHMLIQPAGDYTVADNYSLNKYGEIGLAVGTAPLVNPTEAGAPGSAEAQAQHAYNLAHSVILDDASTTEYLRIQSGQLVNAHIPIPYLTIDTPVTVGAPTTFTKPVVVHYSHDSYRFQPQVPLTGDNPQDSPASFADIRTAAPEPVGGSLTLGTFNVLNYFTNLGVDYCTANQNYKDRDGNPITANGCLPRGAWDQTNLDRQEAKIVAAINAMDADVISLEEIENSAKFGEDRDAALATLVDALNQAAGSTKWAFVPSPAVVPATGDDVIRTAFIYQPATVGLDGESVILDDAAFANARAPLSQAFTDLASGETFVVIVNHFKSKGGSGTGDNADVDDTVGPTAAVGGWNGDRTRQAQALVAFSEAQQAAAGTDLAFLVGDFNSYSMESPITTMTNAGYVNLGSSTADEYSYLFEGTVGSLDHVLASPAAAAIVTGSDYWTINASEPLALEYSRYNYNATLFWDASPYRSSDHNPEVVGLQFTPATTPPATTTPPVTTTPPSTTTPGTTTPGSTTPGSTTPGSTTPGATTPGATTPGATTPATTVPAVPTIDAPATITDAALVAPGLPVTGSGFVPGQAVEVVVIGPDGTRYAVPFADASVLIPDANGTIALNLTASGLFPAGRYTVEVSQGGVVATDVFEVTSTVDAGTPIPTQPGGTSGETGAPVPPRIDGGELATTGADGSTGWIVGGLATLLVAAGIATIGLRRRTATAAAE